MESPQKMIPVLHQGTEGIRRRLIFFGSFGGGLGERQLHLILAEEMSYKMEPYFDRGYIGTI